MRRILTPVNDSKLTRESSINQFEDKLAVLIKGEWVPLSFDIIDGINCGKVRTHKAVLNIRPSLGYAYDVKECNYLTNSYLKSDDYRIETRALPEYYGAGFYQAKVDREILVNADNTALGVSNQKTLRVGTDYVRSRRVLKPVV